MGLLDDAIREHLELKRLRGADAGEVAREEREALGSRHGDDAAHDGHEHEHIDDGFDAANERTLDSADRASGNSMAIAGETVEIDMDEILEEHADNAPAQDTADARASRQDDPPGSAHRAAPDDPEESLEWEMPRERDTDHGGDPSDESDPQREESADDVLEETPDFLRETPEQDRLWFEQRPPRDFDFNE